MGLLQSQPVLHYENTTKTPLVETNIAHYALQIEAQQPRCQLDIRNIEGRTAPKWVCYNHSQYCTT